MGVTSVDLSQQGGKERGVRGFVHTPLCHTLPEVSGASLLKIVTMCMQYQEISTPHQLYCKVHPNYNTSLKTQYNEVGGQYYMLYEHITEWELATHSGGSEGGKVREDGVGGKGEEKGVGKRREQDEDKGEERGGGGRTSSADHLTLGSSLHYLSQLNT